MTDYKALWEAHQEKARKASLACYHKKHDITEDLTEEEKKVRLERRRLRAEKARSKYDPEKTRERNRRYYETVVKPRREAEKRKRDAELAAKLLEQNK